MDISHLALALGSSLTAGLNLYITILSLGIMHRLDWLSLPSKMEILANPWVMGTAAALLVIEFVADKIPYLDNTWDAIHTFIRVPAGAVLASSALVDVSDQTLWIAALLGGAVSFTAHGAKASTRVAVNSTPEPFSNWFLSFLEDGVTLLILWLVSSHPYIALASSLLLLGFFIFMIYLFYRFFRLIFRSRELRAGARTSETV